MRIEPCSTFDEAFADLQSVVAKCSPDDEQSPVDPMSVLLAVRVLTLLIDGGFPKPDFGIDPDGEVTMDWQPCKGRLFSMAVLSNSDLIYAWILNKNHGNGFLPFDLVTIPPEIISKLCAATIED